MVYSGLVLAEGEPYTFPEGGDPSASSGGRSRWEPPGRHVVDSYFLEWLGRHLLHGGYST